MQRQSAFLVVLLSGLCLLTACFAEDLPPYKRLLTGEVAKKAAELEKRIGELAESDKYEAAIQVAEELLGLRRRVQGANHHQAVDVRWALDMLRQVAALPDVRQAAWHLAAKGEVEADQLENKGRQADALPLLQKMLDIRREVLGEAHPKTATGYNSVAHSLFGQSKPAEADRLFRKALDIRRQALGDAHPVTANSYNNLAMNLNAQGKYVEAESLLRKALDIFRQAVGEAHPGTAASYNNVGYNQNAQGKYAQAEPLFRRALEIRREVLGEDHTDTAASYNNVASILSAQGNYATAEPPYRKALYIHRQALGEAHPRTTTSYNNLAHNLDAQRKYAEAEPLFRRALVIRRKALGEAHADTAVGYNNTATNLSAQAKYFAAESPYRKALDILLQSLGESHPLTAISYNNMAANLNAQQKFAEAEPLFRKALDTRRHALGEAHADTATSYQSVAANLNSQGKYADAEPFAHAAVVSLEAVRLHVTTTGLERARAQRLEPRPTWVVALVHSGRLADACQAMEGYFGRGLLDDIATRAGLKLPPVDQQSLDQINAKLLMFDKQINDLLNRKGGLEEHRKQFEQLAAERNKVQEELSQFAAELNRREVYEFKRIQQQLPKDAALVFWLDLVGHPKAANPDGEHWGFVLKATGYPIAVQLSGTGKDGAWTLEDDELAGEVRTHLGHEPRRGVDLNELCRQLGRQRLSPFEPHLKDVKHLIVLPSPALRGIPLEALTDRFLVSYATSGTLLTRLAEKSQRDKETRGQGEEVFARLS